MRNPKIVIIDDNYKPITTVIIALKEEFGEENVLLFNKSKEGLEYVLEHLYEKMILILDWDLGPGEVQGIELFETIQKETSLIYTIFVSGVEITKIRPDDLLKLINNHAFYFIPKGESYKEIVNITVEVSHLLQTRIDCAIEEWIHLHSSNERDKPYISTMGGKTYNLNELLTEIRKKTDLGMRMERNLLQLTIDLLVRQKKKIKDD